MLFYKITYLGIDQTLTGLFDYVKNISNNVLTIYG